MNPKVASMVSSSLLVAVIVTAISPVAANSEVTYSEESELNTVITGAPDAPPYISDYEYPNHAEIGGKMYFIAPSDDSPFTIYSIDSNNDVTQISDANSGFENAHRLHAFKGDLLFIAEATDGEEYLWKYEVDTEDFSVISGDGFSVSGDFLSFQGSSDYVFILTENMSGGLSFYRYDGSPYATEYLNLSAALDPDLRAFDVGGYATSGDKLVFNYGSFSSGKLYAADASKSSISGADLVEVGMDEANMSSYSVEGVFGDDILLRLWISPGSFFGRGVLPNNESYSFADGIPDAKRIVTNGSKETEGLYARDGGLVRVDFDNYHLQAVTIPDSDIPWQVNATTGDLTPGKTTNGDSVFRHEVGGNVYLTEYDEGYGTPGKYFLSAADKSYLVAESSATGEFITRPFAFNGLIWFQNNWGATSTLQGVDPTDPTNMSKQVEKTLVDTLIQTRSSIYFGFEDGPIVFFDRSNNKYSYKYNSGSKQEIQVSDIDYVPFSSSRASVNQSHYFVFYDSNFADRIGVINSSGSSEVSLPAGWDLEVRSDFAIHAGDIYFIGTTDDENSSSDDFLIKLETSDNSLSQVMSSSDIPDTTQLEDVYAIGDYLYLTEEDNESQLWRLDSNLSGSRINLNDGVDDIMAQAIFEFDGGLYAFGCYDLSSNCDDQDQYFWSIDFDSDTVGSPISSPKVLGLQNDTSSKMRYVNAGGAMIFFPVFWADEGPPTDGKGLPVIFDGNSTDSLTTSLYFQTEVYEYNQRIFATGKLANDKAGPWRLLELVDDEFVSVTSFKTLDDDDGIQTTVADGRFYFEEESFAEGRKASSLNFDELSVIKTYSGAAESGTANGIQTHSNSVLTIPNNSGNLAKAGETFSNWNTKSDGTGVDYSPGQTVSGVGVLRLFPKFTANSFTLSFDVSTADSGSVSSLSGTTGLSIPWPTDLTKAEHVFAGWNTKQDGTGASYLQGSTIDIDSNVTLYAQWSEVEQSAPSPSPSPSFTTNRTIRAEIVNGLLVIHGSNFNTLDEVHVDGFKASILTKAESFALATIPSGANGSEYSIELMRNGQRFAELELSSLQTQGSENYGEISAWTKRISDTQAKVYVKYPTVGSKVRILHQEGGSGDYASIFAKTVNTQTDDFLRVVEGVGTYIVRTIDLDDINRIRVRVDDQEIWKVRYNR